MVKRREERQAELFLFHTQTPSLLNTQKKET
jgi:hypothetical protein